MLEVFFLLSDNCQLLLPPANAIRITTPPRVIQIVANGGQRLPNCKNSDSNRCQ